MIRSLQDWWCANAQDGLPDRAHFQPADFKHMLPFMLISDVEHTPFRIRYRLVGTRVVAATGLDVTGMYLDTLEPVGEEEPWMEDYALSYQNRRPVVGTTTTRTPIHGSRQPVGKSGLTLKIDVQPHRRIRRRIRACVANPEAHRHRHKRQAPRSLCRTLHRAARLQACVRCADW